MSDSISVVPGLGGALVALALVVALIIGLGWLLRRVGSGTGGAGIRVVATLAVGVKERLVVVAVGEQQMLIGVTAQQITALATLDRPLAEAEPALGFAALLRRHAGPAVRP